MLTPGRKFSAGSGYRYEFNGKEKDTEVMGEGNFQDYGMRMYNTRLGSFISVDPLTKKFPMLTPFQFASNTPIWATDLDGLEAYYSQDGVKRWQYGTSTEIRVVNNSFVNANTTSKSVPPASLNANSVTLANYCTNVTDVTKGSKLETWANNNRNCNLAATAQMKDAGVTTTGRTDAIQTIVDNSIQGSNKLAENKAGGAIYTMTQLKEGKPVMVGLQETSADGSLADVGNYNRLTGHFVVVNSCTVSPSGIQFGYRDNASSSCGDSPDNQLKLNTGNGEMKDDTNPCVRGVSTNTVSEVRKNKK